MTAQGYQFVILSADPWAQREATTLYVGGLGAGTRRIDRVAYESDNIPKEVLELSGFSHFLSGGQGGTTSVQQALAHSGGGVPVQKSLYLPCAGFALLPVGAKDLAL